MLADSLVQNIKLTDLAYGRRPPRFQPPFVSGKPPVS